jgi:aromatic amino acid aminotransferase I
MMEEYTFSSAQETALPLGLKVAPIKMDAEGLLPESLDEVLSNWDEAARGARKPFVLYTIPTGQNPTGATQQAERRKAIYKVAQKHDVYIVEDEPYYFLQMQPYTGADSEPVPPPANHAEFIKSLIPSYLSLDVDGRVLRLESFSKVIAPGSRVGWAVGSEQIIERFTRTCETSSQNPSGISQLALYKLLDEHWGHAGYLDWLIQLRMSYTSRRDSMVHACEQYLPQDIAYWNPPAAGMFVSTFLQPTAHTMEGLIENSTGLKSTGGSILDFHLARPAKILRRRCSMLQSTMVSWSLVAAGLRLRARARTSCSSVPPSPLLVPIILLKLFPVLARH